jgi:hypothetical protein
MKTCKSGRHTYEPSKSLPGCPECRKEGARNWSKQECRFSHCTNGIRCKGLCASHYARFSRKDENWDAPLKVHRKNGDKLDNRIKNLELWSTSQPSGQRVEDKLAWAREFVARYESELVSNV